MKKLILILISIFIFTSYSFGAEEKARSDIYSYGKVDAKEGGKITTRGSGGKIEKITPRKDIKIFKSNLEKRSKLKKYTKT